MQTLIFSFFLRTRTMLFLSNKATFNEFVNFDFDRLHEVRPKPSLLLLNRFSIRFDVEMMYGHLWVKAGHVCIAPSEDINIFLYKSYEVFSFCLRQAITYKDGLWVSLSAISTWITLSLVRGSHWLKCFSRWRSSYWAHRSVSKGSILSSCCT